MRWCENRRETDRKPEVSIEMIRLFGSVIIKSEKEDGDSATADAALDVLFNGNQKIKALEQENAELKGRLAAIESRLTALNGQGQAILEDVDKSPGSEESNAIQ